MAATKVMKLWTALVAAVLAVFAALGLSAPAAASAPAQKSGERCNDLETALDVMEQTPARFVPRHLDSLPPTMKQRIAAEAHGSSPSCRRATAHKTAPRAHDAPPQQESAPGLEHAERQSAPLPAQTAPDHGSAATDQLAPDSATGQPKDAPAPAPAPAAVPAPEPTDPVSDADAAPDADAPESAAVPESAFPAQRQGRGDARPASGTTTASGALSPTVVHQARPNVYEDPTAALLAGPSGQILS